MNNMEELPLKWEEDWMFRLEVAYALFVIGSLSTSLSPLPYGRYFPASKSNGRVISHKNACHVFIPVFLSPILQMLFAQCRMLSNFPNFLAMSMFVIHYFYRTVIYPIKYLANSTPWPIDKSHLGTFVFIIVHGSIHGFHLTRMHRVPDIGLVSVIGLILQVTGLAINIIHDRILFQIRNVKEDQASNSNMSNSSGTSVLHNGRKYSIPRGGLFEFVSAANYLGEIVEWWGWALFTRGFPQLLFAVWATIVTGIRGWQHHQFYKRVFGKAYPAKRRAIIPFIL